MTNMFSCETENIHAYGNRPTIVILMGVAGCGKSTIGRELSAHLGWEFIEGDDYHPHENINKMAAGSPLTDQDRAAWLSTIRNQIDAITKDGRNCLVACSALKQRYREVLQNGYVRFVYLHGSYHLIRQRLSSRVGHFMRPEMLDSQFETLEEPNGEIKINIDQSIEAITKEIMEKLGVGQIEIGMIGLGVMGRNIATNLSRNGIRVIGFDQIPPSITLLPFELADSLSNMVGKLAKPRTYFLMVPSGQAVDDTLASLTPMLGKGDTIIDGGNSHFLDTERRADLLAKMGVRYIGMGVSGGELGALLGPSMMPGGDISAWGSLQGVLARIAAVAPDGLPCVEWMGRGGAGHYVKMVHNGIEYAEMQCIAEVYDLFSRGLGLQPDQISEIFEDWNKSELASYLVELTAMVLRKKDPESGDWLVKLVLDEAAQKGTGKWASQHAFDLGIPTPTINAAVEARIISAKKPMRIEMASVFGTITLYKGEPAKIIEAAKAAYVMGRLAAYDQGLRQIRSASEEYSWEINLSSAISVWRAGCIIRSSMLDEILKSLADEPTIPTLFMGNYGREAALRCVEGLRFFVVTGVSLGIPIPALGASLAYFDSLRSATLPANLIQAQRDCFGAHTYRRIDKEGVFHTDWQY